MVEDIYGRLVELFDDWVAADVADVQRMPATTRSRAALHNYHSDKLQSWLVIGRDLPSVPLEEQAALDVMNYRPENT